MEQQAERGKEREVDGVGDRVVWELGRWERVCGVTSPSAGKGKCGEGDRRCQRYSVGGRQRGAGLWHHLVTCVGLGKDEMRIRSYFF